MDKISLILLFIVVAVTLGAILGYFISQTISRKRLDSSEELSNRILEEAKKEAETIKKEAVLLAKENLLKQKVENEKEARERKSELENLDRRLRLKEENLEKRLELQTQKEAGIENRERSLLQREGHLTEKQERVERLIQEQRQKLEVIAGFTAQQAKAQLIRDMEAEARHDVAVMIRKIEDEALLTADRKSCDIVAYAIQRYAGDVVTEKTVSVVSLPNDEMKGRIIGREGRNIRAIEAATGIDLIVDDTPEAVVLSSFDPVRREVARLSIERLIADGRIHPGRIEEVVKKVRTEVENIIRETGQRASFDVGVHDIHPEIITLLGSLKYRTSYSQNVLQHSIDVAYLTGMMAAELKMNVKEAKRAGLLHDIGKAMDHKVEGQHAAIGADFARRFGESKNIVQAIASHHEDGRNNSILAVLVQAADTLSAARPGARREMLESYVKRLEDLERIANSFNGVDKCFAIQAGREIRIMVENDKISDSETVMLCRDIIKKIETDLTYPGHIKVTIIRETRFSDFAK